MKHPPGLPLVLWTPHLSLWQALKQDGRVALLLALASFVIANGLVYGASPFWLHLDTPLTYDGDGLAFLFNIQRLLEGTWYFEQARSGYPFGSQFQDFPQSDFGNYGSVKLLGELLGSHTAAINVYFLLGFPICAVVTFAVLRGLGLQRLWACVGALLYAFMTYHFARLMHIFFTWYWVLPLYLWVCYLMFAPQAPFVLRWRRGRDATQRTAYNATHPATQSTWAYHLKTALLLLFLASFGGYYALFAMPLLALSGLLMATLSGQWLARLWSAGVACVCVLLGVLINTLPTTLFIQAMGVNPEALNRTPFETELYGLKIVHLFLPHLGHRWDVLQAAARQYDMAFLLNNENSSAAIGLLASVGVVITLALMLRQLANARQALDGRIAIAAVLILGLIALGTIGGLASVNALLLSSTARGWNRVGIAIGFLGIFVLLLILQLKTQHWSAQSPPWQRQLPVGLALVLVVLGLWDQTPARCADCVQSLQQRYDTDARYFAQVEQNLLQHHPEGSAVLQLPYQPYPGSPVGGMDAYDHAKGPMHTQQLRWSYGDIRWRDGDWFHRQLASLPPNAQWPIAQSMGYGAIYIDKRGLCDAGQLLEADLRQWLATKGITTPTVWTHPNGQIVIYALPNQPLDTASTEAANTALASLGYTLNAQRQPQPTALTLLDIDLRHDRLPSQVKTLEGLSTITVEPPSQATLQTATAPTPEPPPPWRLACDAPKAPPLSAPLAQRTGRWSDARLNPTIDLWLDRDLPASFELHLTARASGQNVGQALQVQVGDGRSAITKPLVLSENMQTQTLRFTNVPQGTRFVRLIPAKPFIPARVWPDSRDTRKLAVELQHLRFQASP